MRVWDRAITSAILWRPLVRACGTLGQFPIVLEQVLEEVIAPLRGRRRPGHFQAAANRVTCFARPEFALPAEPLFFDLGGFRLWANIGSRASTVGLAKSVAAGNQRDRFFVVHRHAVKRLSTIS